MPDWVERPLGRYYMYFAHHMGAFIRLAYADADRRVRGGFTSLASLHGARTPPSTVRSPIHPRTSTNFYTHVASPEIYVDARPNVAS